MFYRNFHVYETFNVYGKFQRHEPVDVGRLEISRVTCARGVRGALNHEVAPAKKVVGRYSRARTSRTFKIPHVHCPQSSARDPHIDVAATHIAAEVVGANRNLPARALAGSVVRPVSHPRDTHVSTTNTPK